MFAAGAVLAVGVVAVMLLSLGTASSKPAEAHISAIVSNPGQVETFQPAEIRVFGVDDHGDVYIQVSAGGFILCEDDDHDDCEIDEYVSNLLAMQRLIVDDDISDTDELELIWISPSGFPGGAVLFTACQADEWQDHPSNALVFCDSGKSLTIQVIGAVAKIDLKALREYSDEPAARLCQGTPVYVIAATEYTFNDWTTFDNNRAVICASVTDSVGHPIANEDIAWTVSGGGCLDDTINNTLALGIAHNELVSCGTGTSGKIATVTANAGVVSNAVQVAFGGDPATCSIPDFRTDLNIGDTMHVVATFLDSKGNKVPDGIEAELREVDSGDGGDNVIFVTAWQDTVNGVVEGDVIAAIAGVVTVVANIEHDAGADTACAEAFELSGNIHLTPVVCTGNPSFILYGFAPPAAGGFGTFAFCGGTYAQLLAASKCPAATSAFFYNRPNGTWAVYIPGADVAAANAEIYSIFPSEHAPIPAGTIFTAKCKG